MCGFGTATDAMFPEECPPTLLLEGALKTVRVNAHERSPIARRRCIEHHGTACAACGHYNGKKAIAIKTPA